MRLLVLKSVFCFSYKVHEFLGEILEQHLSPHLRERVSEDLNDRYIIFEEYFNPIYQGYQNLTISFLKKFYSFPDSFFK